MNKIAYSSLIIVLLLVFWAIAPANNTEPLAIHTQNGPKAFKVEIPETKEEKQKGLMHRTSMPANHGMLFIWEKDIVATMWMKNTFIALDMLFIDSTGHIVYIADNTKPESLTPITANKPVRAVLELAAGTAKAHMIEPGDRVEHRYFRP
ncbi:MAG: DUF192 domain-containing protein [Rickettsiales bacterium]